jgi:hypothetical protein
MVVSKRIMEGRGNPGEGLPHGWIRKKEPALKLSYYYNEVRPGCETELCRMVWLQSASG